MQIFVTLTNIVQIAVISGVIGAVIGAGISIKLLAKKEKGEQTNG